MPCNSKIQWDIAAVSEAGVAVTQETFYHAGDHR